MKYIINYSLYVFINDNVFCLVVWTRAIDRNAPSLIFGLWCPYLFKMDKWINTLGSWASQLYSSRGGMWHITIQLYKTETNRKTEINQGKDRLTNIYLKNIYAYIHISHTHMHLYTYIHTYKHIHNTHIQQKTSQCKEHDTLGKQKERTES